MIKIRIYNTDTVLSANCIHIKIALIVSIVFFITTFFFSCPGSNPGSDFVFSCHVSLVPLICTVPKAYFIFHDADILQS